MRNLIAFFVLLLSSFSFAQTSSLPPKRCATFESGEEFRRLHPGAESVEQFEAWIAKKTTERTRSGRVNIVYTIPVVFHVVHNGEPVGIGTNLSQFQIQQQLAQLNKDFANQSGSTYAVAANTDIQFCLAVVGQDGKALAEPGINRINRNAKGWLAPPYDARPFNSYVDTAIMPSTIWNPRVYFNIWVVELGFQLLGKATFPASSSLQGLEESETDTHAGVILHYGSVGSLSAPGAMGNRTGLGRTLTHEAGHYLGLRHIWGDGECEEESCCTDYVDDTPPQNVETVGCPADGTLNGCNPVVPKMFQNYMDYTDDPCVNTFTADQKIRMQTVMANSPRRKELAHSTVCSAPAGNTIRFGAFSKTLAETGITGTCPMYRDITVDLNVFTAATGDAVVTFATEGTATPGKDYQVLPATLTYSSGETGTKSITIRIMDDGTMEGPETIILKYTISGNGVAAASESQTFTLTILDDDINPTIGSFTLLNENFETAGGAFPSGWAITVFNGENGINQWVVGSNVGPGISGQAAYITYDQEIKPLLYSDTSTSDVGLITPLINGSGMTSLSLSFTYKSQGESDGSGIYDGGILMYSEDGVRGEFLTDANGNLIILANQPEARSITVSLDKLRNKNFYLIFRWVNDNSIGGNPPLLIDNVVVNGSGRQIESELSNTGSQYISSGEDVFIYSQTDGQILARVTHPSQDLGCVTATITSSGTGMVPVTTVAGSFMRTQKVIQISAAIPNPSVIYQATLYFSSAELAAWGVNRTKLKILKVKDGVSLSGTLHSANSELVEPVSVVENTTLGYIAYTANFTGFSQFMLVSPTFVLPVNFISFEARPEQRNISLTWKTSAEKGNRGYHVERSINGSDFMEIGWVRGSGNTNRESTYRFWDRFVQPNTYYHYRLKQVDEDNRHSHSIIRQARVEDKNTSLNLSPNPARDLARVFVSGVKEPVDISLLDSKGQEVRTWRKVNASDHPFNVNISGLAAGYYMVIIRYESGRLSAKLMVE